MKTLILLAGLLLQGTALAQQKPADLDYSYVELRFVDVDSNGGDGFRINASYDLGNNWQIVGGLTSLDFNNNVDSTAFELGAGYVWHYSNDFDFFSTLRYVNAEIDNPVQSIDDDGLAFSAGTRGPSSAGSPTPPAPPTLPLAWAWRSVTTTTTAIPTSTS